MEFTTLGALIGLVIAIILIIKKVHPAYSLIIGALLGGLIGGGGLTGTVNTMITGAQGMMSSVLRILTSGILAGALIKTGSAEKIADIIVQKLGEKFAIISIASATMIICAVGVFIDISVITVAPIAMAIGKKAGYNKPAVLLAMIGGGKAGNIISPNANTIATAEAFQTDLTSLMIRNLIPAIAALCITILLASVLSKKKNAVTISENDMEQAQNRQLPSFTAALAGPLLVIVLLALRPVCNISIDPLIALLEFGNLPAFLLAPISGILMAGATASTTAGATIASQTFSGTLLTHGISAIDAGAMIHTGATVVDSLPHGSFFHATGGSVNMMIKDRIKLIPYEALVGLSSTLVSIIIYLI